jgi:hypothetical protein
VLPWFLFALALALAGLLAAVATGGRGRSAGDQPCRLRAAEQPDRVQRRTGPGGVERRQPPVRAGQAKQVAVIPARIDYTVDLAAVDRNRMRWDAATRP